MPVKTLTIDRRTLSYTLRAGGRIIQRGTLNSPRHIKTIAGYCKKLGYSVIVKGKTRS